MDRHPAAGVRQLPQASSAPATRLAFIDSLRGLAAIYALTSHLAWMMDLLVGSPRWALPLRANPRSGVTMFFLISAFSLCYAHREGFSRPGSLAAFYLRRAARILPLFYAMLVVTLVRNTLFTHWPTTDGQVARAVLLVFNFFPGEEGGLVPGAWTIGAEVVFYAVFPFVFQRTRSLHSVAAASFAALLAGVVFHHVVFGLKLSPQEQISFSECSFLRHLPVFLLGMGMWMLFDRFIRHGRVRPAHGAALILGSAWAYYAYTHGSLTMLFPDPYYWEAIIFAALILGLGILPTRLVVNRAMLFCGRISYSIYLLHPTIMFGLRPLCGAVAKWHCTNTAQFLICFVVTLACVIPLAALSYQYIERPGMRLGSRLIARMAAV